ncbi:hypothetical protein KP004_08145 [Geomonas oryzisoli]|uniref:Glycosyl hydrolase family 13 catalytic domain-containing protein n=1 Tax=Geomonas oryzisoli TaxID=2847992 RepID=A0ABX8JAV3_9BACT|nr:alpha-amylase family glycosyl hydrolase [Geomonas oryzisoli]QWV95136.1 hypothetical protein KP004_08145 [Geomonas oryzisoli]
MFDLSKVGARVDKAQSTVTFSIFLPSIVSPAFSVRVLYITKEDQFNKNVPSTAVTLKPAQADGNWGQLDQSLWESAPQPIKPGATYLYRYEITGPAKKGGGDVRSIFLGDPCARETSSGVFSVFATDQTPFQWTDSAFKVPSIRDAIIYELNVAEFNRNFLGIVDRLPYLNSLGVNVLELLPVTSVHDECNWGYMPMFYFSPEERYGGPQALKHLVNESHKAGIAVILDMVYAHTDCQFHYQAGYDRFFDLWRDNEYTDAAGLHRSYNPIVSEYSRFGHKSDFRMRSTIEFYTAVNRYWIEEFHVDGFRYDHVNGFLDKSPSVDRNGYPDWDSYRPTFRSLQELTKDTYHFSKNIDRFKGPSGISHIIQIAEDLSKGSYQLAQISNSAINGCWEETVFDASTDMAVYDCLNGSYLNELLLSDSRWEAVKTTKNVDGDEIPVSPILYNNCHDKSHLMYRIDKRKKWDDTGFDYPGDPDWTKLQPYAIALLTAVGTPMLWEGEEFREAYGLPNDGQCRVRGTRPICWEYFYSQYELSGSPVVLPLTTLYRCLGAIRTQYGALRGPRENAKKEIENFIQKTLVYRRWLDDEVLITAVNFSDQDATMDIPFGHAGKWVDVLEGAVKEAVHDNTAPYERDVSDPSMPVRVVVPSNFGRIFRLSH